MKNHCFSEKFYVKLRVSYFFFLNQFSKIKSFVFILKMPQKQFRQLQQYYNHIAINNLVISLYSYYFNILTDELIFFQLLFNYHCFLKFRVNTIFYDDNEFFIIY